MKRCLRLICLWLLLLSVLTGCGSSFAVPAAAEDATEEPSESGDVITIGFSQLGAESDWRRANTESMLAAFPKADGYQLLYQNGQQKQSNQITAIRTFIQQEVDYIVLAPATETGWESVLEEAREAGIPVILVDRRVDVKDKSLYTCWVGSDFELEGKKITAWLRAYAAGKGISGRSLHVVNIQGTIGSTAQIGRTRGLANASRAYGWELLAEMSGEFTQTKGREVMSAMLGRFNDRINVVYCENDNEAIGAIEAIEAAGKRVGNDPARGDILVLSFDGVNEEARAYAREGKIACIGECNPLHGPRVRALIEMLERGETPDKFNYVDEKIYSSLSDVRTVMVDGVAYEVEEP
ncbi:MAG: ABC transporter substrate-binding protein [Lachnospiraceae bacterium]|nr:ABC transporter substrate-binding protein [Lachnospiraceae bacterium]